MADRDRLILLTGRSRSRHQYIYSGISLSENCRPSVLGEEETWSAWVISNPPVAVDFVHHSVTSAHLTTTGGSRWEHDGIISKASDWRSDPARPRQNEVSSLKCVPPVELALPVFVGSDPELKPCRDTIIMRLNIRRLMEFPDIKVHFEFNEGMFGPEIVAKHRLELEGTSPEAGTVLPVEIRDRGPDRKATRCVLLLQQRLDEGRFLGNLYRCDNSGTLHRDEVLRRRAYYSTRKKMLTSEADIGTVEKVVETNEITAEKPNHGIMNQPADGAVFPIVCTACSGNLNAADFSQEQMQVIDLWTWYYPVERERALLERAVALLKKYPALEEKSKSKLDSWFEPENIHKKIEELTDPRSEAFQKRLLQATADDLALRAFMNRRNCDYVSCYQGACERAEKHERRLNGRAVICPRCGEGAVIFLDSRTDLACYLERA